MPQRPECDAQYAPKYGCYCATCRPLRKFGFLDRDCPGEVVTLPPPEAKLLLAPPPAAPVEDPRAIAARVEPEVPAYAAIPSSHAYHPDQDYYYSPF